ncbi:hypothetical protein [Streptomyces paradoxus]|uniref:hypothetical protein n=1 Tax=Streptomyces paradoxus TaxID=66375 RepID=UPI0037D90F75
MRAALIHTPARVTRHGVISATPVRGAAARAAWAAALVPAALTAAAAEPRTLRRAAPAHGLVVLGRLDHSGDTRRLSTAARVRIDIAR